MYSYGDRIRAVRLYMKLGKHTAATLRQLGYPTKNALKRGYREYVRYHDLPVAYVRSRPKYSDKQKRMAVEHYMNHGNCFAWTTKALGYPGRGTLRAWVNALHPEVNKRVVSKSKAITHHREVKQAAVIDLCTRRESTRAIAHRVGVSRQTLYKWKNQLPGYEVPASMTHHDDSSPLPGTTGLEQQTGALRRDIRQLRPGHDLLKKANELLKKDLGIDLRLLTNREKTLLVDALRQTYMLPELFAELNLARSSCFYHRGRLRSPDR